MADASVANKGREELVDLPPGFRFHPTDEEIITHYLLEKVMNSNFSACAIGEADLNKSEPWDLAGEATMGKKEWYFFWLRDRKYPTGTRTNRATEAGYWKATGKDKEIFKGKGCLVGMKKTLVFYKGRAPRGEKTDWVMHEYRLEGKFSYYNLPKSAKDGWVVCRVFYKNTELKKSLFGDEFMDYASLPPLIEPSFDWEKAIKMNPTLIPQFPIQDSGTDHAAVLRGIKSGGGVEQFPSNQSMDTGLSTDIINNNEISSVISNSIQLESFKSYDDIQDLACLWNC